MDEGSSSRNSSSKKSYPPTTATRLVFRSISTSVTGPHTQVYIHLRGRTLQTRKPAVVPTHRQEASLLNPKKVVAAFTGWEDPEDSPASAAAVDIVLLLLIPPILLLLTMYR